MKKSTRRFAALAMSTVMALGVAQFAMAASYVVQKGDYLSKIAPRYNTTWRHLADLNNLANPNLIYPNQVLQVPDVGTDVKPTTPEVVVPAPVVEKPEEVSAALLTNLSVDDITLTGNGISPAFNSKVKEYVMNVQSDIYSVKVTPIAKEGALVTVNDEAVEAGESIVVKLNDTYEYYAIDYSIVIDIVVTEGDNTDTYKVTVVRENGKAEYDLFEEKVFTDEETGLVMPYLIYVPSNYDETKEYPVVFALHGSGQRAQTTDMLVKRYAMATVWAADSEAGVNECIVLAPQCASKDDLVNWTSLMTYRDGIATSPYNPTDQTTAAYNLLEVVMEEYSTDADRVYMTGLSAGGMATFAIAIEHPETFAALVPVCGGAEPELVGALKGMPMWIFHAIDDPTVPVDEYLYPTLEALDAAGITYKTTIYDAGEVFAPSAHFSWVAAYDDKTMRDWLFQQSK